MIGSLWSFGAGYGSQISAQLSVGREGPSSGYIIGGVNLPLLNIPYAPANCASMPAGKALEIWAIQTKAPKGKI
jgi:hypothetical protein